MNKPPPLPEIPQGAREIVIDRGTEELIDRLYEEPPADPKKGLDSSKS